MVVTNLIVIHAPRVHMVTNTVHVALLMAVKSQIPKIISNIFEVLWLRAPERLLVDLMQLLLDMISLIIDPWSETLLVEQVFSLISEPTLKEAVQSSSHCKSCEGDIVHHLVWLFI